MQVPNTWFLAGDATITQPGTWLTDHGRAPIEISREGRLVEVELASGKIKKYWKGSAKSLFNISWTWVPSSDANTADGWSGRDTMRAALKDSQILHTLKLNDEYGGSETYTVWVEEYSETLKRRTSEDYFWDITISFKEQ